MSEPLGCSDHFCQESAIPCLETVSEEARRHTGNVTQRFLKIISILNPNYPPFTAGLDGNDLSDYYFRDSFEHSSSESGFTNYDRSYGPKRLQHNNKTTDNLSFRLHHHHANNSNSAAMNHHPNAMKTVKKFSILHAFIPSFLFVIVVLIVTTIFIFESESDIFVTFKNLPEMMNLKYQYYQPLKDFIFKRLGLKE